MTKTELIKALVAKSGQDKKVVEAVLNSLDETIRGEVSTGNSVALMSLGSFKVQDRQARTARNPATGETVQVPAKRVAKFAMSKSLKDACQSAPSNA